MPKKVRLKNVYPRIFQGSYRSISLSVDGLTEIYFIPLDSSVFCPGLKKGMVLIEEKGHFCS